MATQDILAVIEQDGELVVDSRLISERLGIQHRSFYRTVVKHSELLERRFGRVRFQIATVTNSAGAANQIAFALLTESQATFVMTLSRNTPEVLEAKADLVDAFEKAKSIIKTVIPAQNDRIRELELEIQLRNAETGKALAEQKLLDTRHYIVKALPEPVQQKILGYTEIKRVEYRDRIIKNEEVIRDGSTVNKTQMCRELGLVSKSGAPNYKALNEILCQMHLSPSDWRLTASLRENEELTQEAWFGVKQLWLNEGRQRWVGE